MNLPRSTRGNRVTGSAWKVRLMIGGVICSVMCSGCHWVREACLGSATEPHALAESAYRAADDGRISEAISLYRQAIEMSPEEAQFHCELAKLLVRQGHVHTAMSHLGRATELQPDDAESFWQLAQLMHQHGYDDATAKALESAIRANPRHVSATMLRAEIARRDGDTDYAMALYHRVLAEEPRSWDAQLQVAELHREASRLEQAAPLLRTVCQEVPPNSEEYAEAVWMLGKTYGGMNRWPDAVAALQRGAALRPDRMTPDDWCRLAKAKQETGDWTGAHRDLQHAIKMDPNHRSANALQDAMKAPRPRASVLRLGHESRAAIVQ